MGTLEQIIKDKRVEVEERMRLTPQEELKSRAKDQEPARNFFQAVAKEPGKKLVNVIAEVKRASPSAGLIHEGEFDPVKIAGGYEAAGADAISCLTDEKYFKGKLEYIRQIKEKLSLPVLRKDFVVDEWQVWESRAAGADAILLIAECLATNEMIDLQILATELRMTTLIEVHDIDNLIRVRDCVIGFPMKSYSLLGINNRDLRTMKVDVNNTLRVLDLVEDRRTLVSESGIQSREHVLRLSKGGVRGVLVGETLMRADNVGNTMWQLFGA
jgi:indole-3-glycerol phosphate synthase